MIKFTIPVIPPSYNQHYKINYNLRQIYLDKIAHDFKKLVFLHTPPMEYGDNDVFYLKVEIHYDWFYKNGKVRKLDIQNMDKLLIDSISERLGFDDCRIWDSHFLKVQSKTFQTNIELGFLKVFNKNSHGSFSL